MSNGSGNGLLPTRWQTILWINYMNVNRSKFSYYKFQISSFLLHVRTMEIRQHFSRQLLGVKQAVISQRSQYDNKILPHQMVPPGHNRFLHLQTYQFWKWNIAVGFTIVSTFHLPLIDIVKTFCQTSEYFIQLNALKKWSMIWYLVFSYFIALCKQLQFCI